MLQDDGLHVSTASRFELLKQMDNIPKGGSKGSGDERMPDLGVEWLTEATEAQTTQTDQSTLLLADPLTPPVNLQIPSRLGGSVAGPMLGPMLGIKWQNWLRKGLVKLPQVLDPESLGSLGRLEGYLP